MIDRSLNYGRDVIGRFLKDCRPYDAVLDIGAGWGHDLAMARQVGQPKTTYAVEMFEENFEDLRAHGHQILAVDIERQHLPLDAECVDVVIANQVLEHTEELFWIFHEISRVLKVGGHFIIGVPNLASLHNRLLLLLGRQPSPIKSNSAHVRGFTRPDLEDFVASCFPGGYRLLGHGGGNFYPFPPAVAKPLARAFPGMAWGLFLHFRKEAPYVDQFAAYPIRERLNSSFFTGKADVGVTHPPMTTSSAEL